jgi:outer membrane lipoprotein-sorting protein
MKKILILICIYLPGLLFAQENAKSWLEKMNDKYKNAKSISFTFQANYYSSAIQQSPSTSMKGNVKFSGTNYYSDAMGEIVIVNKKYMLLIDKTQKTITCLPGSEKDSPKKDAAAGQPDSTWLDASKMKLLTTSGTSRKIEISGNDPIYEKTEITINAITFEMEQVIFYYKKQEDGASPRLIVNYTNVKFDNVPGEADFSEKKYIQKKNGKLSATTAYSAYKIIDLTSGKLPE